MKDLFLETILNEKIFEGRGFEFRTDSDYYYKGFNGQLFEKPVKNQNTNDVPKEKFKSDVIITTAFDKLNTTIFSSIFFAEEKRIDIYKEKYDIVLYEEATRYNDYSAFIINYLYYSHVFQPDFNISSDEWLNGKVKDYMLINFRLGGCFSVPTDGIAGYKKDTENRLMNFLNGSQYKYYPTTLAQSYLNKGINIKELYAQASLYDQTYDLIKQKTIKK